MATVSAARIANVASSALTAVSTTRSPSVRLPARASRSRVDGLIGVPALHAVRPSPLGSTTPSRSAISRSAYAATCASWVTSTHRRALLAGQPDQLAEHLLAGRGVERAGRLVGEQHPRLGDQRPGDGAALLLAAGHLARPGVGDVGDAEPVEPRQRRRPRLSPPRAGEQQRQCDVLRRGQLGDQLSELEQHPELGAPQPGPHPLRPGVEPVLAVEHLAGVGPQDAGQAVQQRRLAAAARPGDGDDLALGDVDVDAAQGGRLPVGLDHVPGAQNRHGVYLPMQVGDALQGGLATQRRSASRWTIAKSAATTSPSVAAGSVLTAVSSRSRSMCAARCATR